MPGGNTGGRGPRIIFGPAGEDRAPKPGEPARGPRVPFGTARLPTPKGSAPRVLPGSEIRRRVPCTAQDLLALDPAAGAALVDAALRMVAAVNLDDHQFEDVLRFGEAAQAEHGRLAEDQLALVGDAAIQQAQAHVGAILELLRALDPETVFATRRGWLDAIAAFARQQHDPRRMLDDGYAELCTQAAELQSLLPAVLAVVEALRSLRARLATLDRRLSAYGLAARFLIGHARSAALPDVGQRQHYGAQADVLETRAASLAATKATLDVGRLTLDTLADGVDRLARSGESVLNEDLPAWHTAFAAAIVAAQAQAPGDLQSRVAQLRAIHDRLVETLTLRKGP